MTQLSGAVDLTTGLVKFGQRYYDPAIGAFTQQDSNQILADPSNGNLYAYAGDNPINFIDPTGQSAFDAFLGVAAAALFVGTTVIGIVTLTPEIGAIALTGLVIGIAVGEPLAIAGLICGFTGC